MSKNKCCCVCDCDRQNENEVVEETLLPRLPIKITNQFRKRIKDIVNFKKSELVIFNDLLVVTGKVGLSTLNFDVYGVSRGRDGIYPELHHTVRIKPNPNRTFVGQEEFLIKQLLENENFDSVDWLREHVVTTAQFQDRVKDYKNEKKAILKELTGLFKTYTIPPEIESAEDYFITELRFDPDF